MSLPGRAKRVELALASVLALVAFLPFLRGTLAGASLYFRDLSLQFFPVRRFVAEGLRSGELRFWNPYAYEGVPLSPPPIGYPLDLLHAWRPDAAFFSLLLALHIPAAALALYALARQLGVARLGAAGAGALFGLGGFALSTVNLYVYAQALPWVPLVVLAFARAAAGERRALALAALAGAILLSTTALEFALQAFLIAAVLAPPAGRGTTARLIAAVALACGLAAFVIAPISALVVGSARDVGFSTELALAHSVHPIALLQLFVGGLFGDPARYADRFWGSNFFPRGFPYVLSLYLGATAVALAATGGIGKDRLARRLLVLALLALVVCLGRWAGLAPIVDALGPLRKVRFPVKAFLTAHLALALLAGRGLDALARADRTSLRRFARLALALGLALATAPALVLRLPPVSRFLLAGFFPPELSWPVRLAHARSIAGDAALGGAAAVVAGLLALAARRGWLRPGLAAGAIALLLASDLLRAGAGLNPTVAPSFLAPAPEVARLAAQLRADGGRLFTQDPWSSPAYLRARAARGEGHELWSFAVAQDTLSPDTNLPSAVATALAPDRTMLVPVERTLPVSLAAPEAFPQIVDRLQQAGVTHVLSLDRLEHPALQPRDIASPSRIAPLALHLYRLTGSQPLVDVRCGAEAAGRALSLRRDGDEVRISAEATRPAHVVLREALAPGWRARVDGRPAAVARGEERYMQVAIPPGRHELELRYEPPRFLPGLAISFASLLAVLWLARPGRRPATAAT